MKSSLLAFFLLTIYTLCAYSQSECEVTIDQVKDHVGEYVVFCGHVTDAAQPRGVKGNPIFLNFGGTYPNHKFTVVIWEEVYQRSQVSLVALEGKEVVVRGKITLYRAKPQIKLALIEDLKLR
jgi:hypothetical protein